MTSSADDELIEILKDSRFPFPVRQQGWKYILGLTVTEDGLTHIISSNKYIPFILSYTETDELHALSVIAYRCLINISSHKRGCLALLETQRDILNNLLHSVLDCKVAFISYKCYILSNISSFSEICQEMTDILTSDNLIEKLMACYCQNHPHYDFLTLVFANLSRFPYSRKLFLNDAKFFDQMFSFTDSKQPDVKRLGIAFVLRNCCLETDMHETLLNIYNILPTILLPLMGSEEYEEEEMDMLPIECQYLDASKERDKNSSVRRILVQALIALCYSEKGWNFLKSKGTYYVVRDLHKWEKDEKVKESIEQLVTYFLIEQYASPETNTNSMEDCALIQQLEYHMVRDLPDFVI